MTSRLLPFKRAFAARSFQPRALRSTIGYSNVRSYADSTHPNEQKDAQLDREKMDTQANEYSKSGTDTETAKNHDAAFNPNSPNDPDEARKQAGKGNEVNPLDQSPANPELSSGTSEVSGGADKKMSEGGGGRQGGGDSTGNKSSGSSV